MRAILFCAMVVLLAGCASVKYTPIAERGSEVYGVFLDQGLVLGKGGDTFDIRVRNNDGDGEFELRIEKEKTASGNDLDFVIDEPSFSLAGRWEKKVNVDARPRIIEGYSYKQDFFPVKVTALKNGQPFSEANVIITVETSG
ncbi:hypothetical protein HY638_05060 [Candidatus Woesearchaeota archaeon]|nr:hypothetical protein [Candidatus Woesearchaeota archaeon]